MASFQDTNMCYYNALTPPSTPTEKITVIKRHTHQVRSVKTFKNQNKTLTTLDILHNGQLYSSNTTKPLKPPEIALFEQHTVNSFLHHKHNKNTFNTNDTDDLNGESPSSLCVTLYPYETETINEKHFTKTSGTPINNHPIGYNDQLEGSPSESYSSPVQTGKLFTNKFPTIDHEYTRNLPIIDDSNNNGNYNDKPNDTPTTTVISSPTIVISSNSPTTVISSISFPEPQQFERKHICTPPPQKK
eukprot:923551_1